MSEMRKAMGAVGALAVGAQAADKRAALIDELLGSKGHPKPTYVHEVSEVVEGLRGEGSQAESDSDEP